MEVFDTEMGIFDEEMQEAVIEMESEYLEKNSTAYYLYVIARILDIHTNFLNFNNSSIDLGD